MKKLVTIFCGMAIAMSAMVYTPMLVDGYQWNVLSVDDHPGFDVKYHTHKIVVDGDSSVNNVMYKILRMSVNEDATEWKHYALLREDVKAQKIWIYVDKENDADEEILLYDFTCEVGDTIETYFSLSEYNNRRKQKLEKTDIVTDKTGNLLKRFHFVPTESEFYRLDLPKIGYSTIYVERYGAMWRSLIDYNEFGSTGSIDPLLCAYD